jgi:hypothetical protein
MTTTAARRRWLTRKRKQPGVGGAATGCSRLALRSRLPTVLLKLAPDLVKEALGDRESSGPIAVRRSFTQPRDFDTGGHMNLPSTPRVEGRFRGTLEIWVVG